MNDAEKNISSIKQQLLESGLVQEIAGSERLQEFYANIAKNPEYARVFAEFYKEYIEYHKKKLLASADGEIDQVFNGHLNVLKQVLSPLDYSDIYIKYQEEEQKFAVGELEGNKKHFQDLINNEKDKIEEILDNNPEYAKMPKFIEIIEDQVDVVDYIDANNIHFEPAEEPKSGKRKFKFNWSLNKRKKDLMLLIAILTEHFDAEELEAIQHQIAMQENFEIKVGGVARAFLENYNEIKRSGAVSKTYPEIAANWASYKTSSQSKVPPTEFAYEEVAIANIINKIGINR